MSFQYSFLVLLLYFITSCNEARKSKPDLKVQSTPEFHDSLINLVDTVKNKPIGHGFYKNGYGEIFEMKESKDIGVNTVTIFDYLDSTIVVDSYDTRSSLKDYLDINTYEVLGYSPYSKDRKYVYFFQSTAEGGVRFLVKNADPRSFQHIEGPWAKDRLHVFYLHEIVSQADPASIRVISWDSAADGKHTFVNGERVAIGN